MTNYKEYRIVGKYGMWGQVHTILENALDDLAYCNSEHKNDEFRIQVREVTHWKDLF